MGAEEFVAITFGFGFLGLIVMFGIILYFFRRAAGRIRVLFFNSEETCRVMTRKLVSRDQVKIGNKTFSIKGVKPKIIKTRFGWQPFFILKHDLAAPIQIGADFKAKKSEIMPEDLTHVGELAVLEKITSVKRLDLMTILMLAGVGFLMGALIVFALGAAGVITFAPSIPAAPSPVYPTPADIPSPIGA